MKNKIKDSITGKIGATTITTRILVTEESLEKLRQGDGTSDSGTFDTQSWMSEWDTIYKNGGIVHTAIGSPAVIRDAMELLIGTIKELNDQQLFARVRVPENAYAVNNDNIDEASWIEVMLMTPFPHWVKFVTSKFAKTGELFIIGGNETEQTRWRTFSGYGE